MFLKPLLRQVSKRIKKFLKTDDIILEIDFQSNQVFANSNPIGVEEFIANKEYISELLESSYGIKNIDALSLSDTASEFQMIVYYRDEQNNKLKKII